MDCNNDVNNISLSNKQIMLKSEKSNAMPKIIKNISDETTWEQDINEDSSLQNVAQERYQDDDDSNYISAKKIKT